jgi:hypothetical protein
MSGLAQEGEKLGSWFTYNGFYNINPRLELFFETQVRTYEAFGNRQTFLIRPYVSYNINQSVQFGLGLEYHGNSSYAVIPDDKISTEEFRTTLQAMVFQKINRISLQHRYRYEFRFLDLQGKQRVRYRLQLSIPLTSPTIEQGVVFLTGGNDFLIDTKPSLVFNQNRLYLMIGYQFTPAFNFQFGYMYIAIPAADNLHRLQFFLTHKLYFFER